MDSQNGGKFKPAYAKLPQDFPTCMQLNQPYCLSESAEHVNLHDFHASISYLPQLISLQAPVSESLLMHPHDLLATKTQISALDPEIRSVIHSYPTVVRQFNEAHGFSSLPESFRELLLETRSDLEYLRQSDHAALMTGMQHYVEGLSTDCGAANQVAADDLNGSMSRGTSNILGLEDDHESRSVGGDNYKSNHIAAIRSLSMRSNSSTDPRLSTDYSNNGGSNQELIINSNKEEVDVIKGQMGISYNGNTNNKDAVDYEKIYNAGSSTIYFGQAPPLDALDTNNIVEQPLSNNNSKRRLSSASIITPPKRAQLECMWDNNINGFNGAMQVAASRAKKSSRNPLGPALNTNLKPRARQGSANDPQSIAARQRRERINMRLKALQELVPNGSKFDLVTMLEKAINYVKFLQLQLKVLTDDEFWRNAHHLASLNNDHNKEEEYSSLESSNVESKNPIN